MAMLKPRAVPMVAALPSPEGSGSQPARPGRIEGAVRLVFHARRYPEATRRGRSADPRCIPVVSDVVVSSGTCPGEEPARHPYPMIQQDESFEPRVIAITRGSTVEFLTRIRKPQRILARAAPLSIRVATNVGTPARAFTRPDREGLLPRPLADDAASCSRQHLFHETEPDGTFDMSTCLRSIA